LGEIWQAIVEAFHLIVTLDPEVMDISGRSLYISVTSTVVAALICIPLGSLIHFNDFRGKRFLINVIQTLFSIPTVVVGLFVFVLFSNAGPLGFFALLFTPTIMIIGQTLLIIPLMTGMTITALRGVDRSIPDTARSLGATPFQTSLLTLREGRFAVIAGVIMGFGRAISEVGLALLVGGNIYGFTRVITTSISLETSMGNTVLSIALGIILLLIALIVNLFLNRFQQSKRDYN
jgi:tungstate transport system permease protein